MRNILFHLSASFTGKTDLLSGAVSTSSHTAEIYRRAIVFQDIFKKKQQSTGIKPVLFISFPCWNPNKKDFPCIFSCFLCPCSFIDKFRRLGGGDPAVIRSLPYRTASDGLFLLPGILSRKKQLLPQILAITADLNRR